MDGRPSRTWCATTESGVQVDSSAAGEPAALDVMDIFGHTCDHGYDIAAG